jgi:hypothetical protein
LTILRGGIVERVAVRAGLMHFYERADQRYMTLGRLLGQLSKHWWGGLLVTCVATMVAGCAVNPVSARSEVAVISADKERELGAEEAEKVEASMGLVSDPTVLAYVQAVGGRVAKQSPRQDVPYTFKIVN